MGEPIKTSFVVVKNREGQIALIQEGGQPRGLWCLPGGHVDEGETLEQAAVREAKEEAGPDVTLGDKVASMVVDGLTYLGNPSENGKMIEVNIFKATVVDSIIRHGFEELDARWCGSEDVKLLNLRWPFLGDLLLSS